MIIHAFEEAGLGKAPFKLADVYFIKGLDSCDFCSTPIKEICVIHSSDGRIFKVGNQCVIKTGDVGLIDTVKRELNALRAKRRKEDAESRATRAQIILEGSKHYQNVLSADAHPNLYWAEQGKTMLDYVEWLFKFGATTGKLKAAKIIEGLK